MNLVIDHSENARRLGQLFFEVTDELKQLKQQAESGQSDGTAEAHLGAFAQLLKNAGLDKLLMREWGFLLLFLLFVLPARSQTLPDAPQPKAQAQSKFFSGPNRWLIVASAGARAFDAAQSCYHYGNGYREVGLPGQGCLTVTGWSLGFEAAGVGVGKLLHHFHHRKLEMIPELWNFGAATSGIAYSFTHGPHTQPGVVPSVACDGCPKSPKAK